MSIQLPDARQLSDEALQVLRLRALRGIELGYSELDLAELLGVRHETISRWWTAYAAEGPAAGPAGRSAPAAPSPTRRPSASRRASTSTPRRTWASRTPCGRAAPCAT